MPEEPEVLKHDNAEPDIEDLMPIAKRMAQYIHDKRFDTVVVGGTSATTAAYMVKTWWQKLYPKQKMPAFLSAVKLSIGGSAVGGFVKNNKVYLPRFINNTKDPPSSIAEYLHKRYPGKLAPDKKVFILEEAVRTGGTIKNLEAYLRNSGLKEIETGTLVAYHSHYKQLRRKPDFVGAIIGSGPAFHRKRANAFNTAIEQRFEKMGNTDYYNPKKYARARNDLKQMRARIHTCVR